MSAQKQPHEHAVLGDTLLYKLRPAQRPIDPETVWRGTIKQIFTYRYQSRNYYVESQEYPGCTEMVYSGQVVGYEPAPSDESQPEPSPPLNQPDPFV